MFSRNHRLAKEKDFDVVFKRGKSFFTSYFTVKIKPGGVAPRFAVVVSTKVAKRAVLRNRIKRIVRYYIRLSLLSFKPGDYIIIARPSIVKTDIHTPVKELMALFSKIKATK